MRRSSSKARLRFARRCRSGPLLHDVYIEASEQLTERVVHAPFILEGVDAERLHLGVRKYASTSAARRRVSRIVLPAVVQPARSGNSTAKLPAALLTTPTYVVAFCRGVRSLSNAIRRSRFCINLVSGSSGIAPECLPPTSREDR